MHKRSLPFVRAREKRPKAEIKDGKIRAPSHAEDLVKCLYDMYVCSDGCDVTLVVETSPIKAHKAVLMACSDYFRAMFSHVCTESETNVVTFAENITSVGLKAVLEFAYTGWLPIDEDSVRDILEVARHFLMSEITKLCEDFLMEIEPPAENFFWFYEIARDFRLSDTIKEQVVRHTKRMPIAGDNYIKILEVALFCRENNLLTLAVGYFTSKLPLEPSEKFNHSVDGKVLISILKRISHGLYTDVDLIRFITKWVGHSPTRRSVLLPKVLGEINLLCLDEAELETILDLDYIKDNAKCREVIDSAKLQLSEFKNSVGEDNPVLVLADTDHFIFCSFLDEGDRKWTSVKIPLPTPLFRYGSQPNVSAADGGLFIFNAFETRAANGNVLVHCFSFDPFRGRWMEFAPLVVAEASFYCKYDQFQRAEVVNKDKYICVGLKDLKQLFIFSIDENKWSTHKGNADFESLFWPADDLLVCYPKHSCWGFQRFDLEKYNWISALSDVAPVKNCRLVAGENSDLFYSDLSTVKRYNKTSGWSAIRGADADKEFVIEDVLQYKDSGIYFIGSIPSSEISRERKIARFILSEDKQSWGLGKLYPCEFTISGNRPCIINLFRNAYIFHKEDSCGIWNTE